MIVNEEISISKDEWKSLNEKFSKDEIKQMISDVIGENNLPMPMREIKLEDAIVDFDKLCDFDESSLFIESEWFTRYDYSEKYPLSNLILRSNNVGNKAPDYFIQENRWHCDSINAPSPYRTWTIEKFRLTLLNALWTLKLEEVNSKTLRSCISLRKYIASQFRPSSAKAIYNHFEAKNVLDFSSGWGDRLTGFIASNAESYVGVDPNANLVDGYQSIIDQYNTGKEIKMINECAEDVDLGDKKFDLVFTSPPYFNIERYTQEANQSFKKYRKLDAWLNEFLFVTLKKAWDHLESSGHMVINISDVYSNHRINQICDPMNDFISGLEGAEYVGCYGYEMRKRPNSKALKGKSGLFAEPMWVWKKT